MADTYVLKSNADTDIRAKLDESLEVNTFTPFVKAVDQEAAVGDDCHAPKKVFKILCVGDYSGGWSKGVHIEDYRSSSETIKENPDNFPVIGGSFSTKSLYDSSGKEIRLVIWNVPEQERFFPTNRILYKGSDGAIVFWGAKSHSMKRALKFKREISEIEPNIPFVFVVDNVFQTPAKWIGQGLTMNSLEEMDSFCHEHGFYTWFEMLERVGGEKSVLGQAMWSLINEITSRN